MNLALIIGIAGAALVLLAYLLSEFGAWQEKSMRYDAVNALGSALLIVYALLLRSVPFVLLNIVWLLVSLRDAVRDLRRTPHRKNI